MPKVLAQVESQTEEHSTCDCDDHCHECECPHLQDCGIVIPGGSGAGAAVGSGGVTIGVTTDFHQDFPEILTSEATATNTCGLELSSN